MHRDRRSRSRSRSRSRDRRRSRHGYRDDDDDYDKRSSQRRRSNDDRSNHSSKRKSDDRSYNDRDNRKSDRKFNDDPFSSSVLVPRSRPKSIFDNLKEASGGSNSQQQHVVKPEVTKNASLLQKSTESISEYFQKKKSSFVPTLVDESAVDVPLAKIEDTDVNEDIGKQQDRDWYEMEDSGNTASADFLEGSSKFAQFAKEQVRWEENQLKVAGAFSKNDSLLRDQVLDEDEMANRAYVISIQAKPNFIEGDADDSVIAAMRQQRIVNVVKDETADMVLFARKGSRLLKEIREKAERERLKEKFWEISGSRFGDVMGVKKETEVDAGDESSSGKLFSDQMKTESVSDFALSKSIKQQRQFLPIFSVKDELMRIIADHQVIVIVGQTGSGKTTQMTQYLYESGYAFDGIIGCTQPRRVAAMSVAKRVSDEMGCNLGDKVGYSIRFESCMSQNTKIKYMTDGILVREFLADPDLMQYSAIIMDEAHERSLNTDVLFGLFRKILQNRRDLKLIVTSATMDSEKFSRFFGNAPVFTIPGRTFKVETYFSQSPCEDYLSSAIKQILTIHVSHPEGDILVFMTGQDDIEATCFALADKIQENPKGFPPLLILPIYSQLPSDLQARIFQKAPPGTRKCIIATNIAETSLTVDGIKYVIDTGYCKLKVYNPRIGMDTLQVTPISQANSNQRAGRAGRTGPGFAYRLFTERAYQNELLQNNIPEIQRTNLANVVLLLKSLKVENMLEFNFMDPPPKETLLSSMYQLWMLGALDDFGNLTDLGSKMALFPLDPPLSKMLIMAENLGCSSEVLTIVSMLSVPTVFHRPVDKAEEADAIREKFCVPESDHLTLLHIYQQWQVNKFSSEWSKKHYLHQKALKRVREIRTQLVEILKGNNVEIKSCGIHWDVIRKTIASAYFHNVGRMRGIGTFVNILTGTPCNLHPTSALSGLGYQPDYVTYHELIMTTKEYMRTVTAIEGEWLEELAPKFFRIRKKR